MFFKVTKFFSDGDRTRGPNHYLLDSWCATQLPPPHVALEHLKCGNSELRCVERLKYTLEFKDSTRKGMKNISLIILY